MNYWLTKFVQNVTKPSKEHYSPRTLYGIVAGIRRFLAEKKPGEDINPLSTCDKRYDLTDDFNLDMQVVVKSHAQLKFLLMNFVSIS